MQQARSRPGDRNPRADRDHYLRAAPVEPTSRTRQDSSPAIAPAARDMPRNACLIILTSRMLVMTPMCARNNCRTSRSPAPSGATVAPPSCLAACLLLQLDRRMVLAPDRRQIDGGLGIVQLHSLHGVEHYRGHRQIPEPLVVTG